MVLWLKIIHKHDKRVRNIPYRLGKSIIEYNPQSVNKILRKEGGDRLYIENIKRICQEQGRSVRSVEKEANISTGYVYKMKNPSVDVLKKIANVLHVDVCELLTDNAQI